MIVIKHIIISILLLQLPTDYIYAGTIDDLKKQLNNSKNKKKHETSINKKAALNILKSLPFNPSVSNKLFWLQNPNEFIKANNKGAWQIINNNNNAVQLQANAPYSFLVWEIAPVDIKVLFNNNKITQVVINMWNKGDCNKIDYRAASSVYTKILERLAAAGLNSNNETEDISTIINRKWDVYNIGRTNLGLSFKRREYFVVKLSRAEKNKKKNIKRDAKKRRELFLDSLKNNVQKDPYGDVYISGIPIIDQGGKGYCAPATCARVLQYYGIDVDMHLLADHMDTARKEGTSMYSVEQSLKFLCRGNPVTYRHYNQCSRSSVKKFINKGIPLIWCIPGHMRLIIGYNEKKREIIYTDSWGAWASYRRMAIKQAQRITEDIYVLK